MMSAGLFPVTKESLGPGLEILSEAVRQASMEFAFRYSPAIPAIWESEVGKIKVGQAAQVFLDSNPKEPIAAEVIRIDPQAMFTPENTYFKEDRVKQVLGLKLGLKGAYGFAKPGMPADGRIQLQGQGQEQAQARRL